MVSEAEISRATRARIGYFKEQADTLTLEGVRRTLETDLNMEKFSLDVHKKFIKQCLEKCFSDADDETVSKTSVETAQEALHPVKEEKSIQNDDLRLTEKTGAPSLNGTELAVNETEKDRGMESDSNLSEEKIRNAIMKRAAYVKANAEKLTASEVRRVLEEDLKLQKNSLMAYKGFIKKEIGEILLSPEESEATNGAEKKHKKATQSKDTVKKTKIPKNAKSSDSSDSNDDLSGDEEVEEERKPKKRQAEKNKASTKGLKRQKTSKEDTKSSSSRKKKVPDPDSDRDSESDDEKASKDNHSDSSAEESAKNKKEIPAQVYGKKVEHLKSIIKSCGMSVAPSIYKRAKSAPENKRDAFLIKELENILEREGLSANPSEKEIKAVKKKRERAKELEGIDTSNIVLSSRRRSTSSYLPPPKPKVEVESDDNAEEEEEDEDNEDDDEDTDDADNDGGESDEGSEDAGDESD